MLKSKRLHERIGTSRVLRSIRFRMMRLGNNLINLFADAFGVLFFPSALVLILLLINYIFSDSIKGDNAVILLVSTITLLIAFISLFIAWPSYAKTVGHKIVVCCSHEFSPQESQLSGIPYIARIYLCNKKNRTEIIKRIFLEIPDGRFLELKNFKDEPLTLSPFSEKNIFLKPVTAYVENLIPRDISNNIYVSPAQGLQLTIEEISEKKNPTFYHIENSEQIRITSKEEINKKATIFSDKTLKIIIRTDETLIFARRFDADDKYNALISFHNDYEFKNYYQKKSFDNSVFRAYNFEFDDGEKLNFTLSISSVTAFEYHSQKYMQLMNAEQEKFYRVLALNKNIKDDFQLKVSNFKNSEFPNGHKLNNEQIDIIAKVVCFLDFYLKNLGEKIILNKNIKQFNSSLYKTENLKEYLQESDKKSWLKRIAHAARALGK